MQVEIGIRDKIIGTGKIEKNIGNGIFQVRVASVTSPVFKVGDAIRLHQNYLHQIPAKDANDNEGNLGEGTIEPCRDQGLLFDTGPYEL